MTNHKTMVVNTALLFTQITVLFRDSLLGKLSKTFRKLMIIEIFLSVTEVYPPTKKVI